MRERERNSEKIALYIKQILKILEDEKTWKILHQIKMWYADNLQNEFDQLY